MSPNTTASTTDFPTSLRNPRHFPSFTDCPSEKVTSANYYTSKETKDGVLEKPNCHWCFFGEVLSVERVFGLRLVVQDVCGAHIPIASICNEPKDVKPGSTVAILYANRHEFRNGSQGLLLLLSNMVQVSPWRKRRRRALVCFADEILG